MTNKTKSIWILTGCVIISTGLLVSPTSAQFGANGGFFDKMLNQALPRVNNGAQPLPSSGGATNYQSNNFPNQNYQATQNPFGNSQTTTNNTSLVPSQSRDWRLGAAVNNTEVGAVVRQVEPGSPAQRAGIEINDSIITISGIQVGYVDSRLNDVGDQIRRSADQTGRVRMLVLDGRTGRLENIDLNLSSASTAITGLVSLNDRGNLQYGSILKVQIENVTRPFFEVKGGSSLTQVYGTGPFQYQLNFDPQYIAPQDQYRLNAVVTDANNQVLYAMREPILLRTGNIPPNINLNLESLRNLQVANNGGNVVTASYGADPDLINRTFQQLLGRLPSSSELSGWGTFLNQGNSIDDLKAKILGSPNFFDRVGNNPQVFIQTMIQRLMGRQPTSDEINAWTQRLQQLQGNREAVAKEFVQLAR